MKSDVLVIIPTFDGGNILKQCIQELGQCKASLLILDSGSRDGTEDFLDNSETNWFKVADRSFNHGQTREDGRKVEDSTVVVFLTQDVLLKTPRAIDDLVQPILDGKAEVSYGRQLPRDDASFFECFPREFNYPDKSHVRSLSDIDKYGAYTFFCSDSFAAYSQKALDEIGGFEATLSHEDYFAVAKILKNGGRIAYVAEAEVTHSHNYSLLQEFRRYFDAGYVRAVNPWVTELVGRRTMGLGFLKQCFIVW